MAVAAWEKNNKPGILSFKKNKTMLQNTLSNLDMKLRSTVIKCGQEG